MVATTGLFVMGSLLELLMCDPLRDPTNSEVFTLVEGQLPLDQYFHGDAPNIAQAIKYVFSILLIDYTHIRCFYRKCHHNDSTFAVLDMNSLDNMIYNFSNYREYFNLDEKVCVLTKIIF